MAGVLKKYSISRDIVGGVVNSDKLQKEIADSGFVAEYAGIQTSDDILSVMGKSLVSEDALDALVREHVAYSLVERKATKNFNIDLRTQAIIAEGFVFDGELFSLSLKAQMNWLGLSTLQALFQWPMAVTTDDDKEYHLSLLDLIPFITTGSGKVADTIGSGRALKLRVNAAQDQDMIDAVVDNR